jgi:hypothetical protein
MTLLFTEAKAKIPANDEKELCETTFPVVGRGLGVPYRRRSGLAAIQGTERFGNR